MTTSVHELDLPEIDLDIDLDRDQVLALFDEVRSRHWLARTPLPSCSRSRVAIGD